jgi:hypothetical protein
MNGIETFSAGTEATAFNGNAIRALEANGCKVFILTESDRLAYNLDASVDLADGKNPVYAVVHTSSKPPSICFSKTLGHDSLPKEGFAAIMTCDSADAACPVVMGAKKRISLPFTDPKASDGSGKEAEVYGAKVEEIAMEMLWVMMEAKKKMEGA